MVIFDANMLIALVASETSEEDKARLTHLVTMLAEAQTYVGVPAPAFAEFFVDAAQSTSAVLAALEKKNWIRVLPLDKKAAIEAAFITRAALGSPGGKKGASKKHWQHVKIDRQIVAIAKANNAAAIYSDDADLRDEAKALGIEAFALADIALPPEAKQIALDLTVTVEPGEESEAARS